MSDDNMTGKGFPTIWKDNSEIVGSPLTTVETYDRIYFEDGLATGKSLYNGFHWMPERSLSEAVSIIDFLDIPRDDTILDYGCAKGFLVKAFRLLGRKAFGADISRYAICTADSDIRKYLLLCTPRDPFPWKDYVYDVAIAKDVLEHMEHNTLRNVLYALKTTARKIFVAVPLGDGKTFFVPEYNYDSTHKIAQTKDWWIEKFKSIGFKVEIAQCRLEGMKENWTHYEHGNAFFKLMPSL